MGLLGVLRDNKGTVSSALGKQLAKEVLLGDCGILEDAIGLTSYHLENEGDKSIRAGAAKIVEKVAEAKPDMVADRLCELMPAFEAREPQTRWMIMQVFGYCAKLNQAAAALAIPYAVKYLEEKRKSGVCLLGAADLYLGAVGALSRSNARKVYPILNKSAQSCIKNEHDWILEAYMRIVHLLSEKEIERIIPFVAQCSNIGKKATRKRVDKFYAMIQKMK